MRSLCPGQGPASVVLRAQPGAKPWMGSPLGSSQTVRDLGCRDCGLTPSWEEPRQNRYVGNGGPGQGRGRRMGAHEHSPPGQVHVASFPWTPSSRISARGPRGSAPGSLPDSPLASFFCVLGLTPEGRLFSGKRWREPQHLLANLPCVGGGEPRGARIFLLWAQCLERPGNVRSQAVSEQQTRRCRCI